MARCAPPVPASSSQRAVTSASVIALPTHSLSSSFSLTLLSYQSPPSLSPSLSLTAHVTADLPPIDERVVEALLSARLARGKRTVARPDRGRRPEWPVAAFPSARQRRGRTRACAVAVGAAADGRYGHGGGAGGAELAGSCGAEVAGAAATAALGAATGSNQRAGGDWPHARRQCRRQLPRWQAAVAALLGQRLSLHIWAGAHAAARWQHGCLREPHTCTAALLTARHGIGASLGGKSDPARARARLLQRRLRLQGCTASRHAGAHRLVALIRWLRPALLHRATARRPRRLGARDCHLCWQAGWRRPARGEPLLRARLQQLCDVALALERQLHQRLQKRGVREAAVIVILEASIREAERNRSKRACTATCVVG
eukprot:366528-Chlamydomonas_euryale.AAC.1